MRRFTNRTFFPVAFATLLCGGALPLWAGVEDLLEPLDFSAYEAKSLATLPSPAASKTIPPRASTRVPILKEDVESRLGQALVSRFGLQGELEVEISNWNPPQILGNWSLDLLQASPDRPAAAANVRFVIRTSAGKSGPINLPVRCRHLKHVYVAGRSLNRGDRLGAHVLEKRLVDVLRQNVRVISADVDLEGYEYTGSVSPGSPIRWNHVNSIPSVRKGQVIDVFASGKGLYIAMKGVAMQNGGNGEYITVRNLSSKQEFQAKVLNENSVKVYF